MTLKKCPYCGGNVAENRGLVVCDSSLDKCHNVSMMNIKRWNTRPLEDALQAEIDRLQKENEELRVEYKKMREQLDRWTKNWTIFVPED